MEPERRNPRLGIEQSRALKGPKERWGKPGPKPGPETGPETGGGEPGQPQLNQPETGTASVNTMGSGHLSGPALHNGWQHSINAGPGRQPRLVASWSAPLGARPPLTVERGLGWGKKSAVPTPIPLAARTRTTSPPKRRHRSLKFLTRAPSAKSSCLDHLRSPCDVTLGP